MEHESSSIRRNCFFPWAPKRPFELISSLASSLFPQSVSEPVRLQLEKREFIPFRLFSSFQNPYAEVEFPGAQGGVRHCHLRGTGCSQLDPGPVRDFRVPGGQDEAVVRLSLATVLGAAGLSLCLVCPEAALGRERVPRKRVSEDGGLFRFLFSPKACGLEVSMPWCC